MSILRKIIRKTCNHLTKKSSWEKNEYFNPEWESRVALMARHIPKGYSVMDMGCGTMTLKKYLNGNKYIPVDYKARDEETVVCDFNKQEFPPFCTDVIFISGCLEYIDDPLWFLKQCSFATNRLILSYCTTEEFPVLKERLKKNWKNQLSKNDIITFADEFGFSLESEEMTENRNSLFVFNRIEIT